MSKKNFLSITKIALPVLMLLAIMTLIVFSFSTETASALETVQIEEETMKCSDVAIAQTVEEGTVIEPTIPDGQLQTQQEYTKMKEAFYNAFNSYIVPTLILFAVCMFVFAGTKLGIEMGKAEDDAKRAEIKKRMVHWIIGIVVVMISPLLVQGIAEIAMGFASGVLR